MNALLGSTPRSNSSACGTAALAEKGLPVAASPRPLPFSPSLPISAGRRSSFAAAAAAASFTSNARQTLPAMLTAATCITAATTAARERVALSSAVEPALPTTATRGAAAAASAALPEQGSPPPPLPFSLVENSAASREKTATLSMQQQQLMVGGEKQQPQREGMQQQQRQQPHGEQQHIKQQVAGKKEASVVETAVCSNNIQRAINHGQRREGRRSENRKTASISADSTWGGVAAREEKGGTEPPAAGKCKDSSSDCSTRSCASGFSLSEEKKAFTWERKTQALESSSNSRILGERDEFTLKSSSRTASGWKHGGQRPQEMRFPKEQYGSSNSNNCNCVETSWKKEASSGEKGGECEHDARQRERRPGRRNGSSRRRRDRDAVLGKPRRDRKITSSSVAEEEQLLLRKEQTRGSSTEREKRKKPENYKEDCIGGDSEKGNFDEEEEDVPEDESIAAPASLTPPWSCKGAGVADVAAPATVPAFSTAFAVAAAAVAEVCAHSWKGFHGATQTAATPACLMGGEADLAGKLRTTELGRSSSRIATTCRSSQVEGGAAVREEATFLLEAETARELRRSGEDRTRRILYSSTCLDRSGKAAASGKGEKSRAAFCFLEKKQALERTCESAATGLLSAEAAPSGAVPPSFSAGTARAIRVRGSSAVEEGAGGFRVRAGRRSRGARSVEGDEGREQESLSAAERREMRRGMSAAAVNRGGRGLSTASLSRGGASGLRFAASPAALQVGVAAAADPSYYRYYRGDSGERVLFSSCPSGAKNSSTRKGWREGEAAAAAVAAGEAIATGRPGSCGGMGGGRGSTAAAKVGGIIGSRGVLNDAGGAAAVSGATARGGGSEQREGLYVEGVAEKVNPSTKAAAAVAATLGGRNCNAVGGGDEFSSEMAGAEKGGSRPGLLFCPASRGANSGTHATTTTAAAAAGTGKAGDEGGGGGQVKVIGCVGALRGNDFRCSRGARGGGGGGACVARTPTVLNKPTRVEAGRQKFLILDCPSDENLPAYIEEMKDFNVTHLVRTCEVCYKDELLQKAGIMTHEWIFPDGEHPPEEIIDEWLALCNSVSAQQRHPAAIAVHCVAGLGRAPVLVAVALIEKGMDPMDAIMFIRERRKGAINRRQLQFLKSYRRRRQVQRRCLKGCSIM